MVCVPLLGVHAKDTISVSSTGPLNYSVKWFYFLSDLISWTYNFSIFSDYKRTLITFKLKTSLILVIDSSQSFNINSSFIAN